MALILGIESSCDDTAAALYHHEKGLINHLMSSSTAYHALYGGIVPELASRDHIRKMSHLTNLLIEQSPYENKDITGIAYTQGPGLAGSLMVGTMFAKSLSLGWNIPAVGVHHIEGHLMAVMLEEKRPTFPFISLIVSGGHTLLVEAKAFGDYHILGQTLDDAAGEAFDKVGKQLGLPYPGGPAVAKLATTGTAGNFTFARPLTQKPGLDFSFSGLKTQVRTAIHAQPSLTPNIKADIALAFEQAVVDTLTIKCLRALKATQHTQLVIAGGVGANQSLRTTLSEKAMTSGFEVFFPTPAFCTDNAAMIAYCGYERLKRGHRSGLDTTVRSRWPLTDLTP